MFFLLQNSLRLTNTFPIFLRLNKSSFSVSKKKTFVLFSNNGRVNYRPNIAVNSQQYGFTTIGTDFQYPYSYGIVYSVVDGVATIYNLHDVRVGECVNFHPQTKFDAISAKGIVANLNKNGTVDVVLLSHEKEIQRFNVCSGTDSLFSVLLGNGVLGRVLNVLGEPIDRFGSLANVPHRCILERKAPGIIPRTSVHESMLTGYKIIDSAVPIGRGQRELILGDRKTGKTAIAVDTIINQVQNNLELNDQLNLFCIYVAVGQKNVYCS